MIRSSTSDQRKSTEIEPAYRRTTFDAICVAVLIAYFFHFSLAAVHGGFREDEMMNMGIYWRVGALKSLLANVVFWKPFCRSGGAFYYLPLYHFFALNPLPYRIVQISILAASIPLVYYLNKCLASSRSVAFLATLALCYHPGLADLVFVGSFIYDVLCGFFYFAALAYYVNIRERGHSLQPLQVLKFLALYIMALNCKEMAVTLPVIVLVYELLKSPRWDSWKAFFRWSWSSATPSLIAGLLTAPYIYGKTHGRDALTTVTPYQPSLSWDQFITSNAKFLGELLFAPQAITPKTLLIVWAIVFAYAFVRRDRTLQLMAFWVVIVPLPIAFILPVRGTGSLYLLLFGWAMIFAKLATDLITLVFKSSIFLGKRVGIGAENGTSLGAAPSKVSARVFRLVATLLVASVLAIFTQWKTQRLGVRGLNVGTETSHVIQSLRSLDLRPTSGSSILLLPRENIFQNKWNFFFLASLLWNDHSLRIWVDGLPEPPQVTWSDGIHEPTSQQLANSNYVISLTKFGAKIIRGSELPKSD
jgi:hypothetical protein